MNADTPQRRDHRFLIGLLAGTSVGIALAIWLTPSAPSELRGRIASSARELSNQASERYQRVSTGVDEAVDDLVKKGRRVRNEVANSVVRGAHEVERIATAIKG